LNWARDMTVFRDWRLSGLDKEDPNRITWIHGTLGVGKSIMAAYFIDLLKCQYPNAIVAYFFCRSKEAGAFTARDILRALSYQCMEKVGGASKALKELNSHGFQISDDIGIGYLFEILLLGPMQTNDKQIFMVLDGLDEADTQVHDRSGRLEVHVLLKALSELPLARILCISRPSADISKVLPSTFNKPLQKEDTQADIDSYVTHTVVASSTLQKLFQTTRKDPLQYFREKGCGIFLWVFLVLQQLERTRTDSAFLKCLDDFSVAMGSMDNFYFAILSKVPEEDKTCVREILRWVAFSTTTLSVDVVQDIVEMCLKEKFVTDFRRLLETECGAFISLKPLKDNLDVHLVHETFRSFLLNSQKCPSEFLLDEVCTNTYIALKCVRCLAAGDGETHLGRYASSYWIYHLCKAKSAPQRAELLSIVSHIFASDGLVIWVRHLCSCYGSGIRDITFEETDMANIIDWLRDDQIVEKCFKAVEYWEAKDETVGPMNSRYIGQKVGKAACSLWASEESDTSNWNILQNSFGLALKYYWKRSGRTQSNLAELRELISTRFAGLLKWSGCQPVVLRNLGLAYYLVSSWNECILCWTAEDLSEHADFLGRLGFARLHQQEYEKAVQCLITGLRLFPETEIVGFLLYILLQVGVGKGYLDQLFQYFLQTSDLPGSLCWQWDELECALLKWSPNTEIIMAILEKVKPSNDAEQYWTSLYKAYRRERGECDTISRFQKAVEAYPTSSQTWLWLAQAYTDIGNHDQAIQTLQSGLRKTLTLGSTDLGRGELEIAMVRAQITKGNISEAFENLSRHATTHMQAFDDEKEYDIFTKAIGLTRDEKGSKRGKNLNLNALLRNYGSEYYFIQLSLAYRAAGDLDQSIKLLLHALDKIRVSEWLYLALFDIYKLTGQYGKAIEVFKRHQKYEGNDIYWFTPRWRRRLLEVYEMMFDYQGAIRTFESLLKMSHNVASSAWPGLLIALAKAGEPEVAICRFEEAIDDGRLKWSTTLAHTMLGIYKKGDERAIARFETLVNLLPLEPWPWHILGNIYCSSGREEKSIEVYQSALEIHKAEYSIYCRLCSLYCRVGKYLKAIECYDIARQIAPESILWEFLVIQGTQRPTDILSPWHSVENHFLGNSNKIEIDEMLLVLFIWYPSAKSYEALGLHQKAIAMYQKVLAHYESVIESDDNSMISYHGGSRYIDTSITFVHKMHLPQPVLWYLIGELHRALQMFEKALEAFKKALDSEPNNTWLQTVIHETQSESDARSDRNNLDPTQLDNTDSTQPVESLPPSPVKSQATLTEDGIRHD
jgi:tetratricopeptide (TPR) repeat protein